MPQFVMVNSSFPSMGFMAMDFNDRLQKAIERGERTRHARGKEAMERELSIGELKSLHSGYRLELSEHIEHCLRKLAEHLPGFKFQTIFSEDGWGAKLTRDDLNLRPGRSAENLYSRLEVLISPFSPAGILEMVVKGTVRNREVQNRKHYQKLDEFDIDSFKELTDLRVLEFAELYSATS